MQSVAIVIPCFNEETRLPQEEFYLFARQHKGVDFIFVNDCSTDGTARVIDTLCSKIPQQCMALHLPINLGKSGAVREGFIKAFAGDYAAIGFWDADLATPLPAIIKFSALLADSQLTMVIGSRVRLLNRHIERRSGRHYLGRVFATMASVVLGLTVYDTQCGAKLFANNTLLRQVFVKPFTVNWIFDVEILARYQLLIRNQGGEPLTVSACEYPLEQWHDVPGSKLRAKDFIVAVYEIIKIWDALHGPGRKAYYKRISNR
ncbi:MAG: glycosyltransferase [Proteobacteria bacterium]|nr:glycosyltransferase [Desulfobulbaceae bacterium]MBU4151341.1 glycosyltransferase [Pseudomonadota bacterium]MDP2104491.1 glycosyltransferase [Desulfobulbaceae bacterium]